MEIAIGFGSSNLNIVYRCIHDYFMLIFTHSDNKYFVENKLFIMFGIESYR